MILKNYKLEIFNNECMPSAMSVQCYAHLDQDVSEALPYLNAVLGGFEYTREPPSVSFKAHGKLINVSGRRIAVNALKDDAEAKKSSPGSNGRSMVHGKTARPSNRGSKGCPKSR